MTLRALVHDYETTGVKPKTCGVVQSAIMLIDLQEDGSWEFVAHEVAKHNPGEPIPDGASKIHGIYDRDVAHLPDYEESLSATFEQAEREFGYTAVIGYNSNKFDNVIGRRLGMKDGVIEIDLFVACQRLMTLGHLSRARLVDAYSELVGGSTDNAHDAEADLEMTLALIKPVMKLLDIPTVTALSEWLNTPFAHPKMLIPFGKYRGYPMTEVPKTYLRWIVEKAKDMNDDLRASAKEALNAHP